jgi:L-ribulokinase
MGLPASLIGVPVSTAMIDAHAGVLGAGVGVPGTLVAVLGTSSCHMLCDPRLVLHKANKYAADADDSSGGPESMSGTGLAGVVRDGILPGLYGYETGQSAVGDAFAWAARTMGASHADLSARAAALPPGSGGVLCVDYHNGARTPLMDGSLSGAYIGITLGTQQHQIYRATIEATAYGLRWICDSFNEAGIAVEHVVASGGIARRSPLLMQVSTAGCRLFVRGVSDIDTLCQACSFGYMQIYADVLGRPIRVVDTDQPVALGAAIIGAQAGGRFASLSDAIAAMARPAPDALVYHPAPAAIKAYDELYALYREATNPRGMLTDIMRKLRKHS